MDRHDYGMGTRKMRHTSRTCMSMGWALAKCDMLHGQVCPWDGHEQNATFFIGRHDYEIGTFKMRHASLTGIVH